MTNWVKWNGLGTALVLGFFIYLVASGHYARFHLESKILLAVFVGVSLGQWLRWYLRRRHNH